MIRLINVETDIEEDVQFGTCEYCFRIGNLYKEILVLEDDKTKEQFRFENGYWSWGDYEAIFYGNALDLCDLIQSKNYQTYQDFVKDFENLIIEFENLESEEEDE